jgi:hypothetical protein
MMVSDFKQELGWKGIAAYIRVQQIRQRGQRQSSGRQCVK